MPLWLTDISCRPATLQQYASTTWSTWLVSVSLLWSPFWFNPGTFVIEKCTNDYRAWRLWMADIADSTSSDSWSNWNKGQLSKMRNDAGKQTNPVATALGGLLRCLPTAILAIAAITNLDDTSINKWAVFGVMTGGFWVFLALVWMMRKYLLHHYRYRIWRLIRTAAIVTVIIGLVRSQAGGRGESWGGQGRERGVERASRRSSRSAANDPNAHPTPVPPVRRSARSSSSRAPSAAWACAT